MNNNSNTTSPTSSELLNVQLDTTDDACIEAENLNTLGDSSGQSTPADGEYLLLMESLQEESAPLTEKLEAALQKELDEFRNSDDSNAEASPYGHPLSVEVAMKSMPAGDEGMDWVATLVPNEFFVNGKVVKGLNQRDFDDIKKSIKPRRPSLPITHNDFFSSVTKVCEAGQKRPRYVFYGILNGWPSLRCFELMKIVQKGGAIPSPKQMIAGQFQWIKIWSANDEGFRGINPQTMMDPKKVYRAKLRGAPWTGYGWSKESPGFVFWYESQHPVKPRVVYGTNLIKGLSDGENKCTYIHMISHRYAKERESPKDRLTYHSICLLEWDHGRYCTVTEAAYLNGIGGYRGRSNWFDDKDAPISSLYNAFPPEMVCPWITTSAEIRCYDVPAKNLDEFKQFMSSYVGSTKRFIDPQFSFSHPARVTFRTKAQIGQYLINYIMRDKEYAELRRNCQTYTADLCAFVAGKKNVQPFHPVVRLDYQNRTHFFFYDFEMYKDKKKKFLKRK